MKVYELRRNVAEIKVKSLDRAEVLEGIEPGCTYCLPDVNPERGRAYSSLRMARLDFKGLRSRVEGPWSTPAGPIVRVTEFYIQELETESDREFELGCYDTLDPVVFAEFER